MNSEFETLLFLIMIIFIGSMIAYGSYQRKRRIIEEYENSAYFQITHLPYHRMINDVGSYGEYLIYKALQHRETFGAKFLFNTYVPKKNGKTSEIDVIMIDQTGVFVFESKNYKGWIFGDENSKKWCQCLKAGRYESQKEYFYNPILQNENHIKTLKEYLGAAQKQIPMHNVVVFSNECDLRWRDKDANN